MLEPLVRRKTSLAQIEPLCSTLLLVWSNTVPCGAWRQAGSGRLPSRAGGKSTVKLVILLSFTGGFVVKTQGSWNRTPVVTPCTPCPFPAPGNSSDPKAHSLAQPPQRKPAKREGLHRTGWLAVLQGGACPSPGRVCTRVYVKACVHVCVCAHV